MKPLVSAILFFLLLSAAPALDVGQTAPPLSVETWLNGEAVQPHPSDGKTVYVVEFWATWCPPCRQTIPHLNELSDRFKDRNVVIVGVTDEREDVVRPFVEKMGMRYRVAIAPRRENTAWTEGLPGIPHAFIVGADGHVVWSGHPMGGLDDALQGILDGTYDPQKAREEARQEDDLKDLLAGGDFDKALARVDAMLADDGKDFMLFQLKLQLLAQAERFDEVRKTYRDLLKAFADSAEEMNTLAWVAATSPFEMCDLQVAWEAATRAVELSRRENSAILDTLARVYYAAGALEKAVMVQEEAIRKCKDKKERADMEAALRHYRSALVLGERVTQAGASPRP